eukprot:1157653-Pelagomonas_calceolata.AAC.10
MDWHEMRLCASELECSVRAARERMVNIDERFANKQHKTIHGHWPGFHLTHLGFASGSLYSTSEKGRNTVHLAGPKMFTVLMLGGVCIVNEQAVRAVGATREQMAEVLRSEWEELERRCVVIFHLMLVGEHGGHDSLSQLCVCCQDLSVLIMYNTQWCLPRVDLYRGGAPLTNIKGRIVLVVDDGLATGVSARAAMKALKVGWKIFSNKNHCPAQQGSWFLQASERHAAAVKLLAKGPSSLASRFAS